MIADIGALLGGTAWDYTNQSSASQEVVYASLTAPAVVKATVTLNGATVDIVYAGAGGTHSWWRGSSGGLLPMPLAPGDRVVVSVSGPCAFRAHVQ